VRRLTGAATAICALLSAPALAAVPEEPWPPASGPGVLFAHYGEEHWNDDDGELLLPEVVEDTRRYRPAAVTMSGDKANDGTVEQLERWRSFMDPYDAAGIPYFAGVGNHDRKAPPGVPGGLSPRADLTNYKNVFAGRPYPFGDAPPPSDPRFAPKARPANDPPGASSSYSFDLANVRWIFIDNSCYSIVNCDGDQNPPLPDAEGNRSQYDLLRKRAAEATARGMLVFVVMHMPTQDDRPGHSNPTPSAHTMGEGSSPDNAMFEQVAAEAGVDGVFLGHIKGQWLYEARGVPYYTDGGAGGEVYVGSGEKVGVDSGYWHGYRLVRVDGSRVITDSVPILSPDGITVSGPAALDRGQAAEFSATGRQPTEEGPKVEALELRDPDRSRSNGSKLTVPARIWTSSNRLVLKPLAASADDPRRDPGTQTTSGRFRGRCPGRTQVAITSGWEEQTTPVTVRSKPGRIVRSVGFPRRSLNRGRRRQVARVSLAQPAEVMVRVRRGSRVIRTLSHRCHASRKALSVLWNGRRRAGRTGPRAARGAYTLEVRVRSDRRTLIRRSRLRLR